MTVLEYIFGITHLPLVGISECSPWFTLCCSPATFSLHNRNTSIVLYEVIRYSVVLLWNYSNNVRPIFIYLFLIIYLFLYLFLSYQRWSPTSGIMINLCEVHTQSVQYLATVHFLKERLTIFSSKIEALKTIFVKLYLWNNLQTNSSHFIFPQGIESFWYCTSTEHPVLQLVQRCYIVIWFASSFIWLTIEGAAFRINLKVAPMAAFSGCCSH